MGSIPEYMYISRYEEPYPFWLLRFRYKRRCIHREHFSDERYGSNELALEAALKKRNKIAHCLNLDMSTHWKECRVKKYRYTQKPGARNKTGVTGVTYAIQYGTPYYRASICLEKYKEKVRSYNCKILGHKEAFRQAVNQRKEWEKLLKPKKST